MRISSVRGPAAEGTRLRSTADMLAGVLCVAFSQGCGGRAVELPGFEPPALPPVAPGAGGGATSGGAATAMRPVTSPTAVSGSAGSGGTASGNAAAGQGGAGTAGASGAQGSAGTGGSTSPNTAMGGSEIAPEPPVPDTDEPPVPDTDEPPPPIDPACDGLRRFDPDEVYIMGTIIEGSCGYDAIAHWSDPNTALAGFGCYNDASLAMIRPKDGALIVKETFGRTRVFREDACLARDLSATYPLDVLGNDGLFQFQCGIEADVGRTVAVAPRGSMALLCGDAWYQGTTVLYDGRDEVFAYDGDRFLTRGGVFVVETQTLHPFAGLPSATPLTWRVVESGFWMVLPGAPADARPELWYVDFQGSAELLGVYPELPAGTQTYFGARLAGDGALFEIAIDVSTVFTDVIVRRSLSGQSDIVYSEADDPLVKLHISGLVSGP